MECDEEEDCEVVLENSELYKYLLNCNSGEFDFYAKSSFEEVEKPCQTPMKTSFTKVPTEYLSYLDAILNSNILLDEDVTYLYGYTVDLISDLKVKKYWDVILSSLLGVCSLTVAVKYNSLIQAENIFHSCLTAKYYLGKWQRNRCLKNLLTTVKQVHLYFKKTLQILYEQEAYFKLQQLKSKTNGKIDDFDTLERKKRTEIDTLSSVLSQCIASNIMKTRDATRCLINMLPLTHYVDSKEHYLAFMSDEQLGLPALTTTSLQSSYISSLDTLKNIYLLIQSEFFRRLGLCFCPTIWSTEMPPNLLPTMFGIIEKYSKCCEAILSVITFYYTKHLYPDTIENHRLKDSTLISGYSSVHKISTSLSQLVMDTRVLEEYIEKLKTFEELNANIICKRLEELKQDVDKCLENVIHAEKYFSKLQRVKEVKVELPLTKHVDKDNKTDERIEIGKSSQNIDSKDRVYFAITEGKIDRENSLDRDDVEPVKYPNVLLTELKEALIEKKNEFINRENEAVDNVDEYRKFLDTPEIKLDEPKKDSIYSPLNELNSCDFQMHKVLASAVAQRSAHFINHVEEQYGSSDESDCDDS